MHLACLIAVLTNIQTDNNVFVKLYLHFKVKNSDGVSKKQAVHFQEDSMKKFPAFYQITSTVSSSERTHWI